MFENIPNNDGDTPTPNRLHLENEETPPHDEPKVEPQIYFHVFMGISTSQTLKLLAYIERWKFIILIVSDGTQIHDKVSQGTHCYIHSITISKL